MTAASPPRAAEAPAPPPSRPLEQRRAQLALGTTLAGLGLCAVFYAALPDAAAKVMVDRGGLTYPFSVQNCMWVVFCIAAGELALRMRSASREMRQLRLGYLPEDPRVVLQAHDLPPIYRRIQDDPASAQLFLPRLITRCILQFQISSSVEQCATLMNIALEMIAHELDLRYSTLRYMTWLIPSLGFVGTVVGIGHALSYAGEPGRFQQPTLLSEVTARLAVSFDGTLVALLMAAVLLLWQSIVEAREERALNLAGQHCLDHLINRLYVPRREPAA